MSGGLFVSTPGSSNLFGGASSGTSGGLFGAPAANTNTGSGLFGAPAANTNTGTNLFGAPAASTNTGTNLFGAPAASTNTGTNLFGAPAASTNTGSGLFGAPAASTNTGSGLFGAPAAGTNTGSSLFGAPAASTSTNTGLFGAPAANTNTGSSLFGAPPQSGTPGLFSTSTPALNTPMKTETMGMPPAFQQMREELENKNSPQYALNAYFYSRANVPQSKLQNVNIMTLPPDVQAAMNNNPDPDHLIPEKVQGFDGLENRVKEQKDQATQNDNDLKQAEAYLNEVEKGITTVVESVLPTLLATYRKLSGQLLETVVKLRTYAGSAYVSADERVILAKLEDIESVASDPAKVCARLDALVEQVRSIAATRDASSSSSTSVSKAEINAFANHLEREQRALKTLVDSIRECEQMITTLSFRS